MQPRTTKENPAHYPIRARNPSTGSVVHSGVLEAGASIDISGLLAGVYPVVLVSGKSVEVVRVVRE